MLRMEEAVPFTRSARTLRKQVVVQRRAAAALVYAVAAANASGSGLTAALNAKSTGDVLTGFINQEAPPTLIQETIQAQSANINMVSGGTASSSRCSRRS